MNTESRKQYKRWKGFYRKYMKIQMFINNFGLECLSLYPSIPEIFVENSVLKPNPKPFRRYVLNLFTRKLQAGCPPVG